MPENTIDKRLHIFLSLQPQLSKMGIRGEQSGREEWMKLDNAAKIYPAIRVQNLQVYSVSACILQHR